MKHVFHMTEEELVAYLREVRRGDHIYTVFTGLVMAVVFALAGVPDRMLLGALLGFALGAMVIGAVLYLNHQDRKVQWRRRR
jgi:predicted PurR-regulated permease PerM